MESVIVILLMVWVIATATVAFDIVSRDREVWDKSRMEPHLWMALISIPSPPFAHFYYFIFIRRILTDIERSLNRGEDFSEKKSSEVNEEKSDSVEPEKKTGLFEAFQVRDTDTESADFDKNNYMNSENLNRDEFSVSEEDSPYENRDLNMIRKRRRERV